MEAHDLTSRQQMEEDAREAVRGTDVPLSGPVPGSLRDRVEKRRKELEERTTELFPVPLYTNLIAVELKVISWAKTEAFITKNQRVPSQMMLSTAGDEITAATVGFHEIKEDGETEVIEGEVSWVTLATRVAGVKLHETASERVALVALCTDQGVMALNGLYRRWLGGEDTGMGLVDKEVKRDF